jgi:hypothetical protein
MMEAVTHHCERIGRYNARWHGHDDDDDDDSYNESSTYYEEDEDGYIYYYDPIFANITTRSPTSNVPRATRT